MEMDYRDLLKRYIAYVSELEGTAFIRSAIAKDYFSEDELKILIALESP